MLLAATWTNFYSRILRGYRSLVLKSPVILAQFASIGNRLNMDSHQEQEQPFAIPLENLA